MNPKNNKKIKGDFIMKTIKVKKLSLSKVSVVNLNDLELKTVEGGGQSVTIYTCCHTTWIITVCYTNYC
jgi:hypothetical protein